jgi:hypothetical protein
MTFPKTLLEAIGYDPIADLDHEAICARGGDTYGYHILLRCPECGHPVLHDYEHDYFYSDPHVMQRAYLQSPGDTAPCPACGFTYTADDIWACSNSPDSMRGFFLTIDEVQQHSIAWVIGSQHVCPTTNRSS